ncbi:hypothetical protein ABPG74_022473 [Tetrahymena malaccensis]
MKRFDLDWSNNKYKKSKERIFALLSILQSNSRLYSLETVNLLQKVQSPHQNGEKFQLPSNILTFFSTYIQLYFQYFSNSKQQEQQYKQHKKVKILKTQSTLLRQLYMPQNQMMLLMILQLIYWVSLDNLFQISNVSLFNLSNLQRTKPFLLKIFAISKVVFIQQYKYD